MQSNLRSQAALFLTAGVLMCAIHSSCNRGSSNPSSASDAFPVGMAVASPTAANTDAAIHVSSLTLGTLALPAGVGFADESGPEKVEELRNIAEADSASDCLITLPPFQSATDPSCYGPGLDYQDNPDAATPNSGSLPGGDLGIWTSTQTGSEACTAAKINALIHNAANYLDYVMHLSAAIICSLRTTGTSLPNVDSESIDLTSALNTAIQSNNPNVTITSATLENLPDVTISSVDHDAYKFTIVASDTTGGAVNISCQLTHVPLNVGNTRFVGRIRTWITGIPNGSSGKATSATYERTASKLRIKVITADYNSTSTESQIFDSATDEIKIDGPWTGNLTQSFQEVDRDTFLGAFSCAWQAGTGDSHARIFNGYTVLGSGCGFFGFGLRFDNAGGTASDNVIDGMICNWAGPGNSHAMTTTSGLAQKQCMTINAGTGTFEIDNSKNNITFAPANSCDGSGTFQVKLTTDPSYTNISGVTNNLVILSSDADFGAYAAPTAPTTF